MIEQETLLEEDITERRTEADTWWAADDAPVRVAPNAAFLIDGRMTMLEMCHHFLSAKSTIHIAAHHQKTVVVDSSYAFVGGIDMMTENGGEYDRWDTKGHIYHHPLRLGKDGIASHCWHDVHILFEGPAVTDVEHNFRQRWNAVVELHSMDALLLLAEPAGDDGDDGDAESTGGDIRIQVTRTVPNITHSSAQDYQLEVNPVNGWLDLLSNP